MLRTVRYGRQCVEWTSDWYVARRTHEVVKSCCSPEMSPRVVTAEQSYDPAQRQFGIPRKVVKGGSY